MKKTTLCLLLVLALLPALCGCASDADAPEEAAGPAAPAEAVPSAPSDADGNAHPEGPDLPAEKIDSAEAAVMRLVRILGIVSLTDEAGETPPARESMRLFSGSAVSTAEESRAGISLDEVKAVTLDEESTARLHQSGRKLALDLESGAMYFSVARPLEDDESFEIHTSTMTMGIRGTSGFVSAVSAARSVIILTSGHAEIITASGETVALEPGRRLTVTIAEDGTAEIADDPIGPEDYPSLLLEELAEDERMLDEVEEQNGAGFTDGVSAMAAYRGVIRQADTYDYQTGGAGLTGSCRYAFVPMSEGSDVPALLIGQETDDYMEHVRIFQYDPSDGSVGTADEVLLQGAAQIGGYRGGLKTMSDGLGLLEAAVSGGTGAASAYRVTLDGSRLERKLVWSGHMDDADYAEHMSGAEIVWYDAAGLDGLDRGERAVPLSERPDYRQYEGFWVAGTHYGGADSPYEHDLAVKFIDETHFKFIYFRYRLINTSVISAELDPDTGRASFYKDMSESGSAPFAGSLVFKDNSITLVFDSDPTGYADASTVFSFYSGSPTVIDIGQVFEFRYADYIKEQLGIPRGMLTEDRMDDYGSYWEGGGLFVNCEFYHDGVLIAGAQVDYDTGELVRNILTYGG